MAALRVRKSGIPRAELEVTVEVRHSLGSTYPTCVREPGVMVGIPRKGSRWVGR